MNVKDFAKKYKVGIASTIQVIKRRYQFEA